MTLFSKKRIPVQYSIHVDSSGRLYFKNWKTDITAIPSGDLRLKLNLNYALASRNYKVKIRFKMRSKYVVFLCLANKKIL